MNWTVGPDPSVVRSRKTPDWSRSLELVTTLTNPVSGTQYESAADSRYVLTFTYDPLHWIEFYYRYQNNSNCFLVKQDSDTGDLYINKVIAGSPTILFYEPAFFKEDPYEIIVEAHGQNHTFVINGALVFARTDPMLPTEAGLRIYDDYVTDVVLKVYS